MRHAHVAAALRRLLVVLGLVVAGWLLSGATQAHAETVEPATAADTVSDAPAETARQVADGATTRSIGRSAVTPEKQRERRKAGPRNSGPVSPEKATERPGAMGAPAPSAADEAVFGKSVENVTTAPKPSFPRHLGPIHSPDVNGIVPQTSGGSGQAGMGFGDIARAWSGARLMVVQVPEALHVPPAVRNGADEPSFSPD